MRAPIPLRVDIHPSVSVAYACSHTPSVKHLYRAIIPPEQSPIPPLRGGRRLSTSQHEAWRGGGGGPGARPWRKRLEYEEKLKYDNVVLKKTGRCAIMIVYENYAYDYYTILMR